MSLHPAELLDGRVRIEDHDDVVCLVFETEQKYSGQAHRAFWKLTPSQISALTGALTRYEASREEYCDGD